MIVIKALTITRENWGEDVDDFFIEYDLDLGPEEVKGVSELFTFEVISPKRLHRVLGEDRILNGRGSFITNDFNQVEIRSTIEKLLKCCMDVDDDKTYNNLSKHFIWNMHSQ